MIVRTLEDVIGTKGEAHGNKWHSMRLLHADDGMGGQVDLNDIWTKMSDPMKMLASCVRIEKPQSN